MNCKRCGRQLRRGELFCLNCGESTVTIVPPKTTPVEPGTKEKPSEIVTCLVIGLFVLFGIPALLFGGYMLAVGTGAVTDKRGPGNGLVAIFVAAIPLGVFSTLLYYLILVAKGSRSR